MIDFSRSSVAGAHGGAIQAMTDKEEQFFLATIDAEYNKLVMHYSDLVNGEYFFTKFKQHRNDRALVDTMMPALEGFGVHTTELEPAMEGFGAWLKGASRKIMGAIVIVMNKIADFCRNVVVKYKMKSQYSKLAAGLRKLCEIVPDLKKKIDSGKSNATSERLSKLPAFVMAGSFWTNLKLSDEVSNDVAKVPLEIRKTTVETLKSLPIHYRNLLKALQGGMQILEAACESAKIMLDGQAGNDDDVRSQVARAGMKFINDVESTRSFFSVREMIHIINTIIDVISKFDGATVSGETVKQVSSTFETTMKKYSQEGGKLNYFESGVMSMILDGTAAGLATDVLDRTNAMVRWIGACAGSIEKELLNAKRSAPDVQSSSKSDED